MKKPRDSQAQAPTPRKPAQANPGPGDIPASAQSKLGAAAPKSAQAKPESARAAKTKATKGKPVPKTAKQAKSSPPPARTRDPAIAAKTKAMAAHGNEPDSAATVLGIPESDITDPDGLYAKDWDEGLAAGEAAARQAVFDQGIGRPAEVNANGHTIRAELKPNAQATVYLHQHLLRQRNRRKNQGPIDWSKVHPEQRPPGVIVQEQRRGPGRPKFQGKFTKAIGDEICARLREGQFLSAICRDDHMPSDVKVMEWAADDEQYPEFSLSYARAMEARLVKWAEIGQRYLEDPGYIDEITIKRGAAPDGTDIVEVRRTERTVRATALAKYYQWMIERHEASKRWALEMQAKGEEVEDLASDGKIEVTIRGGTPK